MWRALLVLTLLATAVATDKRRQHPDDVSKEAMLLGEVKAVHILHRHGARAPQHIVPSMLPLWNGLGVEPSQLTLEGIQQMEALGTWIRQEYLTTKSSRALHDGAGLLLRSVDVDRCLTSAATVAKAMLPEHPLPVHTVSRADELLLEPSDQCASYVVNTTRVWKAASSGTDPSLIAALQALVKAGSLPSDTTVDSRLVYNLWDNLASQQALRTTPTSPWDSLAPLLRNASANHNLLYFQHRPEEVPSRGPLGAKFAHHLVMCLNRTKVEARNKPGRPETESLPTSAQPDLVPVKTSTVADHMANMFIYSAHDSTITSLHTGLGLDLDDHVDRLLPPFGAVAILELRADRKDPQQHKRQTQGASDLMWYVNLRYGWPVRKAGNGLNQTNGTLAVRWEVAVKPAKLRCPTLSHQCKLDDFTQYLTTKVNPQLPATQGCCARVAAFVEEGCDHFDQPASELNPLCLPYRRHCPLTACGASEVLEERSLKCIHSSTAAARPEQPTSREGGGIAGLVAIAAVGWLFGLVVCVVWIRTRKTAPEPSGFSRVPQAAIVPDSPDLEDQDEWLRDTWVPRHLSETTATTGDGDVWEIPKFLTE